MYPKIERHGDVLGKHTVIHKMVFQYLTKQQPLTEISFFLRKLGMSIQTPSMVKDEIVSPPKTAMVELIHVTNFYWRPVMGEFLTRPHFES